MRNKAPVSAAPAVDKALDILEYVARSDSPVSANAAVRALGMPVASGFRVINALLDRSYLRRANGGNAIGLGLGALKLGSLAMQSHAVRAAISPVLERIRDRTRESVELAWLEGREIVIVDVAESPEPIQLIRKVGTSMLGLSNPITLAVLAFLPDDKGRELVRAITETVRSRRRLGLLHERVTYLSRVPARELDKTRRNGFAADYGRQTRDIARIAVPILDGSGTAAGALSVVGPLYRIGRKREKQIVGLLKAGAQVACADPRPESRIGHG
ncbi:MAG: helix-turn-helix domain-containing protein [Kiritimatiellae bacterium]|nr:helix-turn-helix domain-containing protein [Kiritimatiellia bacterium]